ncbi:MAG: hypothetical protein AB7E47_02230 [Desulfovibrionaceae bacterium]
MPNNEQKSQCPMCLLKGRHAPLQRLSDGTRFCGVCGALRSPTQLAADFRLAAANFSLRWQNAQVARRTGTGA